MKETNNVSESILPLESFPTLNSDYFVTSQLGKGTFGTVYEIISLQNMRFAAKVNNYSRDQNPKHSLSNEHYILQKLKDDIGFPIVKNYFLLDDSKEILIMSLLGSNLQRKLQECGGRFSLKTVLMIGYQAIERLEAVHSKGFVHRDIKPENFLIGFKEGAMKIIHLIDFGLSCSYLGKKNKHMPFGRSTQMIGTLYYLSVYGHLGIKATRRDDLISLGYMLIHLLMGQLPWMNVKGSTKEKIKNVFQIKSTISLKKLCENLPGKILDYFEYVLKLKFFEKPDYEFLKEIFISMMDIYSMKNDGIFDWISNTLKQGINLSARKLSSESPNSYMKKNVENESIDDFL